jgi:hypothetical protein
MVVKLMVELKNLFWPKDGQGPCLEDANDKQHLPLHNELLYQICHLYSELGAIKASAAGENLLSQRQNIKQATPPVRTEGRNRSWPIQSIINSKLLFIFPPKDLLCIVCTINIYSTDKGYHY